MNRLVKNELSKIFHKKALYIIIAVTLAFMIINGVLNKVFSNDFWYQDEDVQSLKERQSMLNLENSDEKEEYTYLEVTIKNAELAKKYDKDSWQYYIINNRAYEIIDNLVRSEGTEEYEKAKKEYDEFIQKLNNNEWQGFTKQELKDIEENIKFLESEKEKGEKIEGLDSMIDTRQALIWRLENDIPYGNNVKNNAVEAWLSCKEQLRIYESESKTKELKYEDKIDKQSIEGNLKVYEYTINSNVSDSAQLTFVNNQTALTSQGDAELIESTHNYMLYITAAIVVIAGTIISEEFNKGTIKLLLVRPYRRSKILIAKFLACIIVLGIVNIVIALLQYVTGGIFYGFENYIGKCVIYNFSTNTTEIINTVQYLLITASALLPQYILIMTLAFSLSVIFTNSPLAIALPLLGTIAGQIINELALAYEKAKFLMYFVTLNWDLRIYLFGKLPRYESISLPFSLLICFIYFAAMIILSICTFKKKEIKNI